MTLETAAMTDVGQQRDHNEDSVLATAITDDTALLAVADGMGGHAAGDVASQLAIDTLREEIVEGTKSLPPQSEWQSMLNNAITRANQAIHDQAADDRAKSGMGTTVVAALIQGPDAVVANVGDSRGYVLADGIEQVTVDQSLVQELVEQGQITAEEAKDHPQRNVISQSLGTDTEVDPDFYEATVDGMLLLCSDGLTEEVDDERIEQIVSEASTVADATEQLIQRANENGGSDNISVTIAEPS